MSTGFSTCDNLTTSCRSQTQAKANVAARQLIPNTLTTIAIGTKAVNATTATIQNMLTKPSRSQRFTAKYIIAILIILTASYPRSSSALPRRLFGRQLIYRHHHLKMRAAENHNQIPSHSHGSGRIHVSEIESNSYCPVIIFDEERVTVDRIQLALNVTNFTKPSMDALLDKYVWEVYGESKNDTLNTYREHHLDLDYKLKMEANNSEYDARDTQIAEQELLNIHDSLIVMKHLMNHSADLQQDDIKNNFTKYFIDYICHNLETIQQLLVPSHCLKMPAYSYMKCEPMGLFIVNEAVKLLAVLEKKYAVMLKLKKQGDNLG